MALQGMSQSIKYLISVSKPSMLLTRSIKLFQLMTTLSSRNVTDQFFSEKSLDAWNGYRAVLKPRRRLRKNFACASFRRDELVATANEEEACFALHTHYHIV